jgi:hypothetical protein
VTHQFDQNQAYIPLSFTAYPTFCRLEVSSPPDSNWAVPGDYMLFIVNGNSTPSIAKWVRIRSGPLGAAPEYSCDVGGGCPFVDTRTASGWVEENTILGRSLTGEFETDIYRLKNLPMTEAGRHQLRIRENEREFTTLDGVRLVAVDHDPGVRVYPMGETMLLATRTPPHRVTTRTGIDVTRLLDGSRPGYFVGEPGETLLVELVPPASEGGSNASAPASDLDPFEIDPGDKGGEGLIAGGAELEGTSVAMDALVLNTSGILVQGRDANGEWKTVRKRYPREHFDEMLVDTLDQGPVRLVFVGRHSLRYVGRVLPVGTVTPTELELRAARHTRLGEVGDVLRPAEETVLLSPGDSLHLEFDASPVPVGQVRDYFLVTRGVYSSTRPLSGEAFQSGRRAARFELLQNQPNPFSTRTRIDFMIDQEADVRLEIFDMAGRRVRDLGRARYPAGRAHVEWDGRNAQGRSSPAAIYFYRLTSGRHQAQRTLMLLR